MILLFSKKMIQNIGNRVCYTLDFLTIDDFEANEEGLPLMIRSDHFETTPLPHFGQVIISYKASALFQQ